MSEVEELKKEKIVAGSYFTIALILIPLGFGLIASNNLIGNDAVIKTFLIFGLLNLVLPLFTYGDILFELKWLVSFMFRPDRSIISKIYNKNKTDSLWIFLYKVNKNPILSLLFWISFWSIPQFFAQLFAPQSAIGTFVSTYVFPVRPQTSFLQIVNSKLFFTLLPAPAETGGLITVLSFIDSIFHVLFQSILRSFTYTFAMILIGGIFSGLAWNWIHKAVSGGREFDKIGHSLFGVESGILTYFTGTFVPATALHINNLLFWSIRDQLAGNEFFKIGLFWASLLTFTGIILIYYSMNKKSLKGKSRSKS